MAPEAELEDLRFIGMRFVPQDTTDFFRLNEMVISERLPDYVDRHTFTMDNVPTGTYFYSGVAQQYASDLLSWRPVGLVESDGGRFYRSTGRKRVYRDHRRFRKSTSISSSMTAFDTYEEKRTGKAMQTLFAKLMGRTAGLVALMILLLGARDVAGQSLSGRIVDESGMPVPGVNVLIEGTSKGAASDTDGRYRIENLDAGLS